MVFATRNGLGIYDSYEWSEISDNPGSANSTIRLRKDSYGNIWGLLDTEYLKIFKLDSDTVCMKHSYPEYFGKDPFFFDFDIITKDSIDYLAVAGSNAGLLFFNGESWSTINIPSRVHNIRVLALEAANEGFFVATQSGLFSLSVSGEIKEIMQFSGTEIYSVRKNQNAELFVLAETGIFKKENNEFIKILDVESQNYFESRSRSVFLPDFYGIYIYGYSNKVYFHDTRRNIRKEITPEFGAIADGATSVFPDNENNIWISNLRGVSRFNAFSILNLRTSNSFVAEEVTAISSRSDGSVIISNPTTFHVIKNNSVQKTIGSLPNPDNVYYRILDLETDSNDNVWFAAEKMGFGYIDRKNRIQQIKLPGNEDAAYSVLSGGKDSLFFLQKEKLWLKTKDEYKEIETINDTSETLYFRKLFKSTSGFPVIASMYHGVLIYDTKEKKYKNYFSPSDISTKNIYSFYESSDEMLVGSSSDLYTVSGDTLKRKWLGDFSFDRPIYFIGKDNNYNFWFGTDKGAYKWDNVRVVNYCVDDGIPGMETNRDAFYSGLDGSIWIGTSQGLSIMDQKLDSINSAIPRLVIDRIETNLRTIPYEPGIILQAEEDGFFVHLKNISYVHEDEISYAVNMEGFDDKWYSVYQEETVPYAPFFDLSAGEYKINIRMYIGYNDLVASTSSSTIVIENPLWDTVEFKLLLLFAVFCGIALIVLYHRKNLYTGKLEEEVDRGKAVIEYSEIREQVIFKNNKNVMMIIEPYSLRIVEVNLAASLFYDYPEKKLQSLTLKDLELQNESESYDPGVRFPANSGNYESVHYKAGGEKRDVEVIYSTLPYGKGQLYFLIVNNITERKRAENAIRDSEEKYRSLLGNIQDGIFLIQDGRLTFVNQSLADMVGYPKKELINRKFVDFVQDDDKKFVAENYFNRIAGKTTQDHYEISLVSKTGEVVYVNIHVGLFKFEERLAVMGTVKNVTEKKKSEEQLRVMSTVVDQSPVCIILTDNDFNITYVNPIFSSSTGYTFSEIRGKSIDILRIYNTGEKEKIKHFLQLGEPWMGEIKNRRKNGATYWASVILSPIHDKQGSVKSYVSLESDISFEKFALEEIKKNEKLLNSVLDNLPVVLFVADVKGVITIHRGGALVGEMAGTSNLMGKSVFDVYSEYKDIINDINRAYRGEWFTAVRKMDDKTYETHYSTLTDASGKAVGIIGVSYDVTEREETRTALIDAKEEAEKSDRLKSEFLAQVSHEIRTPINSILSFASLIKEEVGDHITNDIQYGFQVIEKGGLRLIRTIDLILNMSQIQTQTYTPRIDRFNLVADIFENLIKEMRYIASTKDVELNFEIKSDRDDVLGDKYTIYQIFNNLVDNAIKYTDDGSVTIRIYESGTLLCVDVEDTGIGMSKEFIKDIFRPFSQEETGYTRKYEGNGLGMALVKEYAKLNNAELDIVSEKGKGTKITVKFAI
ncbi:MAG: hypothetical protein SCALA702_16100 [Melioribacteraceae bacterium]|nr:MAG: hypothetical protein SCALA702_16100 [Melioribacteraceae bacterium]